LRASDTPQTLIERADTCLYAAKRMGRNCVIDEDHAGSATKVA
jgi:PleD family two-component response regulator